MKRIVGWLLVMVGSVAHAAPSGDAQAGEMVPVPGRAFAMGKFEVTVGQWAAYAKANHLDEGEWSRPGFPQDHHHPVINVSFEDVEGYIAWLNKRLKPAHPYRLPTEDEWEFAARGGAKTDFPWGASLVKGALNCDEGLCADGFANTSPVGSFPANAYGLFDMIGNVREWTSTCFEGDCDKRVIRGGSWDDDAQEFLAIPYRSANAVGYRCNEGTGGGGFRLAQDL